MKNVQLISRSDVAEKLTMKAAIQAVEEVYQAHAENEVVMPSKITLDLGESTEWPPYKGSYNAMPAYIGKDKDISGMKWVWGFEDNPKKGLPYISGLILLNDPHTGELLALMDGSYLTDIRTGASAGIAVKYLKSADAKTAGIIGAGTVGKMNLRALHEVMEIEEVFVKDLFDETARKFAKEMSQELGIKVTAVETNQAACTQSDIIITATIANEALVKKEWLRPGTTVISMGSFQELDEAVPLTADKLIVDNWEQNAHRGELLKLVQAGKITAESVYADMPELISKKKIGRISNEEIICVCIIGMGSTDIGTAADLYKNYFEKDPKMTFDFRNN